MIVLGLPAVSLPGNLDGDSGFLEIYRPLLAMSERFPVWAHVHVPNQVLPDVCASFTTPRVRVVRNGNGLWDKWFPDLHAFSVMFCKEPVDLVFTQQKPLVHMLHATLNDHRLEGPTIPIVLDVLKVGLRGATHDLVTTGSEAEEAVALLFSEPIVSTPRERDLAIRLARKVLSPTMVDRMMSRVHVVADAVADAASDVRPVHDGPITVGYIGRLNHNKMYMRAMMIADDVFRMGTPVKVIVITNTKQGGPVARVQKAHPYVEVLHDVGKEAFLQKLSTIDIVVNASHEEGYCVSVAELLAAGKMLVLPDRPWVHALAGADYPFRYRSVLEAIVHIKWLVNNLNSPKVERVRQAMRARFHADRESVVVDRLHEIFLASLTEVNTTIGNRFVEQRASARGVMDALGPTFTFAEFRTQYLKLRSCKSLKSQRGSAGEWYLYKWIRGAGYDVADLATLTFARRAA